MAHAPEASYQYHDTPRQDVLRMVPADGRVIGAVGCGWAATERVLADQGRTVHGVDISEEAIAIARTRLASARTIRPGDRGLFEAASLDGLILSDVLEHMPQAWLALSDLAQSVKTGGWVVISVPNMQSLNVLVQLMVLGDWPEKSMGIFDSTHIQMMTRKRLLRWCAMAKLTPVQWFDRYEDGPRGKLIRWADKLTLGVFHDWATHEWQCVFRKT